MDLERDKRQNIQKELDFSSEQTGEARQAGRKETESRQAMHEPESPANTIRHMEEVCERENLLEALRRVKGNKGSAGIDGMTVDQLSGYLKEHWLTIREQLLNGTYKPQPVRRVEIEKPDGGGMRKLGIPTTLDRFLQQAVMQVLQRQWDPTFSDHSYGFRPSQSRQTDGSNRKAGRGQAAAETHPGIPERRGDGERAGQPQRGRDSARGATFASAQQPRARRTRPRVRAPGTSLCSL